MKIAVIDIGSNSVRYAILTPETEVAAKELDSTVLADGLFFSGKLNDAAIERTAAAVEKFCRMAKAENADEILIFATEAVRAASNGKQFTEAVYERTGIAVDVIEGATEAQIGFLGAIPAPDDTAAIFDMGGASCEIIIGDKSGISYSHSFPIGCVRLRDGADGDKAKADELIRGTLPLSLPAAQKTVGIGGTATALGAMLYCRTKYDPETVHKSRVDKDFLTRVISEFFGGKDMRGLYPVLTPNRARVIGYGAMAALRILELFGADFFTVSERDNIEGYAEYKRNLRK